MFETTLAMLKTTNLSIPEISRQTGLKTRWLHRLAAGDYSDPGVNKIEVLHNYLKAQQAA